MKFYLLRLALGVMMCGLWAVNGHSQFKRNYSPDTVVLKTMGSFGAVKVLATDLPGREIAVMGTLSAMDSGNVSRTEMYLMLLDLQGNPQGTHLYEDTSAFSFFPPKTFGGCYDGGGEFYFGVGANGSQVIFKTDTAGQVLWSRKGHHHEYYSLLCEGGTVAVMGQDESTQGGHDFSVARFDSVGGDGYGEMHGTIGFDVPQRMTKIDGDYFLVGSNFATGSFKGLVIRTNPDLSQAWGKVYRMAGKSLILTSVHEPLDGNGLMVWGRARATPDSLVMIRLDDAGTPLWARTFGVPGSNEFYHSATVVDPVTGGYIVSGHYRGAQYLKSIIFMTDSTGNLLWVRDPSDQDLDVDETVTDMVYSPANKMVYAVGDRVVVGSPNFEYNMFMVAFSPDSGSIPCDSIISLGSAMAVVTDTVGTVEEPFLANSHFPIGNMISANFVDQVQCEVMVARTDVLPDRGVFQLVNPSDAQLRVQVQVLAGGGTLEVYALTGELVWQEFLPEGMHQVQRSLPGISSGLYLVRVAGQEWRYPTRRWAVQR